MYFLTGYWRSIDSNGEAPIIYLTGALERLHEGLRISEAMLLVDVLDQRVDKPFGLSCLAMFGASFAGK